MSNYANKVNSQFTKRASHYVNIKRRLKDSTKDPWQQMMVASAIREFKLRNPNLTKFKDLQLCRAIPVNMNDIEIDITLQRLLDIRHECNIIDHWNSVKAMPICVYEDPSRPGKYICWDGQHTLLAMFIIATMIMGENASDIKVPVVIYSSNQKSVMRDCFISLNGEAKKPLDHIDKIHQKIYAIRTDGSTNPAWLEVEQKQQYLEQHQLFLTHEKFGDTHQDGAMTRVDEFIDSNKFDPVITEDFSKYYFAMCRGNRPVMRHETWTMYEFFNLCRDKNITVDNNYIADIAISLKTAFNGVRDFEDMLEQAKMSWRNWYMINKPMPGTLQGIQYPPRKLMMTFLLAQLAKNFKGPLPVYNNMWDVPKKDLF